jgi:hypothetical protein
VTAGRLFRNASAKRSTAATEREWPAGLSFGHSLRPISRMRALVPRRASRARRAVPQRCRSNIRAHSRATTPVPCNIRRRSSSAAAHIPVCHLLLGIGRDGHCAWCVALEKKPKGVARAAPIVQAPTTSVKMILRRCRRRRSAGPSPRSSSPGPSRRPGEPPSDRIERESGRHAECGPKRNEVAGDRRPRIADNVGCGGGI